MSASDRFIIRFPWIAAHAFLAVLVLVVWLVLQVVTAASFLHSSTLFLKAAAAIGLATAALIEMAKRLRWLVDGLDEQMKLDEAEKRELLAGLTRLAVTKDVHLLFQLPIEQLCAQMMAGVELLLAYPEKQEPFGPLFEEATKRRWEFALLVHALAGQANSEDADAFLDERWKLAPRKQEEKADSQIRGLRGDRQETSDAGADEGERSFLNYRTRLTHHFQRNIDRLQMEVGLTWRHNIWIAVAAVSTLLAGASAAHDHENWRSWTDWPQRVFFTLAGGLAGGFLATVTRDLTAVIEKLRR
jgi:hypothetical protein